MQVLHYVYLFFGGMFLMNAVPHLVSAVLGRAFQTPFASPPGEGLSSSTVNAIWGFANLVAAYILLVSLAGGQLANPLDTGVAGLGGFGITLFSARHFGRFHGGNVPNEE